MDNKEIKIDEKYLRDMIQFLSSKLVGKIMKRFELATDKDDVKKQVKELIYESHRDLLDIILAYDAGRELTIFNFKTKNDKPTLS